MSGRNTRSAGGGAAAVPSGDFDFQAMLAGFNKAAVETQKLKGKEAGTAYSKGPPSSTRSTKR